MALPNNYLCSFSPLCINGRGRMAIEVHKHPQFIDGSCRREPDLESEFPSISALCRADKFAPKLQVGDRVVYVGKKGKYSTSRGSCWPLVALLKVEKRFENHEDAAKWYRSVNLALPKNCMVECNPPLELEHTSGPKEWGCLDDTQPGEVIDNWDRKYRIRAKKFGAFLACSSLWMSLHSAVWIDNAEMERIMGRRPGTQTPPRICDEQFDRFLQLAVK